MRFYDYSYHILTLAPARIASPQDSCRLQLHHLEHALQLTAASSVLLWSQYGMLLQKKLPTEFFEKQNIWLYRGNMYRLLVEPCDIANHYGLKSMSGVGHYLAGNRPGR